MRQVRTVPNLPTTGRGLLILPHELAALDMLPDWCFRLFAALVRLSDYRTGEGSTSYEHLRGLMTPDQPPSGPAWPVRTRDEIKNMLRRLEVVGLLTRHTRLSEAGKAVFFDVKPRSGKSASDLEATRQLTRRENPKNPDKHGGKSHPSTGTHPRTHPPIQGRKIHKSARETAPVDNLPKLAETLEIGPPKGAGMAAAPLAPPTGPPMPPEEARARLRRARDDLAKRAEGEQSAPPRGQRPARQGAHAPRPRLAMGGATRTSPQPHLEEGSPALADALPDGLSPAKSPKTGAGATNGP